MKLKKFIYDEKKRNAVIDTIRKDFPLNVMYWVKAGRQALKIVKCYALNLIDEKVIYSNRPNPSPLRYSSVPLVCQLSQTAKISAQKTRVDLTVPLENKGLEGVRRTQVIWEILGESEPKTAWGSRGRWFKFSRSDH